MKGGFPLGKIAPFCLRRKAMEEIKIVLSKRLYQKEAVIATTYIFTREFRTRIEPEQTDKIKVTLKPIAQEKSVDPEQTLTRFMNEIVDQQLRLDLDKSYGNLRELIVKKAFFPVDLKG
jgi:His-Xaa-Ser system protein HxsD